jgi:hypothetical protein
MDLKFRSDLLGRSVLFMGYSFQDINIRVIWFKLMDMMKDIPVNERPTSFILRLNSNPALERLYDEVGIKTIVLDPNKKAASPEQKAALLNDFMFTIATLTSPNCKIPGQKDKQQFFSAALADLILAEFEEFEKGRMPARLFGRNSKVKRVPLTLGEMLEIAGKRTIPNELQEKARAVIDKCATLSQKESRQLPQEYVSLVVPLAVIYSKTFGIDPLPTFIISVGLGRRNVRETLLGDSVPWDTIWAAKLTTEQAGWLLKKFEGEIESHEENPEFGLDHDLAFVLDPIKRILAGQIYENGESDITHEANSLIQRAGTLYPAVLDYTPNPNQPPNPTQVIAQIDEREAALPPADEAPA